MGEYHIQHGLAGGRNDSNPKWNRAEWGMILLHYSELHKNLTLYQLLISKLFHVIFSDHGWPQVTEMMENEYMGR
jgi:hypothetical protein